MTQITRRVRLDLAIPQINQSTRRNISFGLRQIEELNLSEREFFAVRKIFLGSLNDNRREVVGIIYGGIEDGSQADLQYTDVDREANTDTKCCE